MIYGWAQSKVEDVGFSFGFFYLSSYRIWPMSGRERRLLKGDQTNVPMLAAGRGFRWKMWEDRSGRLKLPGAKG